MIPIPFDPAGTLHAILAARTLDAARLLRHDPITALVEVMGWNGIEITWQQAKAFVYNEESKS